MHALLGSNRLAGWINSLRGRQLNRRIRKGTDEPLLSRSRPRDPTNWKVRGHMTSLRRFASFLPTVEFSKPETPPGPLPLAEFRPGAA